MISAETLKLRRLRATLAVFEQGSGARASQDLRMSQPAVATAIVALERDLGAVLFERSTRGMTATEAGRLFCQRLAVGFRHLAEFDTGGINRFSRLVSEGQLRALKAICEEVGFSAAARRLGLSQPSVHRAARELELLCGVGLWVRDGANARPNETARRLARQAGLFRAEIEAGLAELADLQDRLEGELNIGALPLARASFLPKALSEILRARPHVKVRILDGPYPEQLTALMDGRIDFILGTLRDPPPNGVMQEPLFDDPLVILVRADHPLAAGFASASDKLTPEQLGGLSWILQREGTPARKHFEDFMAAKGLASPARVVECSSVVATRALLLSSDHAAVLSRRQAELEVGLGLLKVMGPPLTGSWRTIGVATRQSFRPTRLQMSFMTALRHSTGSEVVASLA